MSWAPEAGLFLCDPSLVVHLRHAARSLQCCCTPSELWIEMLRQYGGVSAVGLTNISQLLEQPSWAGDLPAWLLQDAALRQKLVVNEHNQVCITHTGRHCTSSTGLGAHWPSSTWVDDHEVDMQDTASCSQLESLMAAGSSQSAAAHNGFLLAEPPLPCDLLKLLPTADMLALSRVCRALQVASYELMQREAAAYHSAGQHSSLDCHKSDKGCCDCAPWQVHTPAALAAAAAHCDQAAGSLCPQLQRPPTKQLTLQDRRSMRALSLLCGSPEAAAELLSSDTSTAGGLVMVGGDRGEWIDAPTGLFRMMKVPEVVLCQSSRRSTPYRCVLFTLRPQQLPRFLQQLDGIRGTSVSSIRELEVVKNQAQRAADEQQALCLLHTLWPID